jgi:hypothetical protein
MNRTSRFRPRLEALEDRSLLSVSVVNTAAGLTIDARQSNVSNAISIVNDGTGHFTGTVTGADTNTSFDFLNVSQVGIYGGPGGVNVQYAQTGNQIYRSPVGGDSLFFQTVFEGGSNTFTASLAGKALFGSMTFVVDGGSGHDTESVNATGVTIGFGGQLGVFVAGSYPGITGTGGTVNFSMDYSGTNHGKLTVHAGPLEGYFQDVLRLDATFLGSPSTSRFVPITSRTYGAAAGDLALDGGISDNTMTMILNTPGGLSATGDVVGPLLAVNRCLRTGNVKSHNCKPDTVLGLKSDRLTTKVTIPHF